MARRISINPLSVLFLLGVLGYGLYRGLETPPLPPPAGPSAPTSASGPISGAPATGQPATSSSPASTADSPSTTSGSTTVMAGQVVKVVDGDTLDVLVENRPQRIRLDGIDAPERGQPFAKAAGTYLGQLCHGKIVHLVVVSHDAYGRTVGDVYMDKLWLSGAMVEAGLAWHYKHYNNSPELAELEAAARRAHVGLWRDPNPVPPWEYRRIE